MANLIQIKRSLNTAAPVSLANGEMAYTANGDVLAIGSNGGIVYIGGKRVPGTLTANQALVANATSGIDKIITANLVPTQIYANGSFGTGGYLLATSGASGNAYWLNPATLTTSPAGSNTQVEFNDSGTFGASAGFTFDKSANNLSVANSIFAATVNAATHSVGTATVANATGVWTTGTVNAAVHSVGTSTVANATGVWTTGTVNAATHSVGTSAVINSTAFYYGTIGATSGITANNTVINIGNNTVNSSINSTAFSGSANNTTYVNGKTEANLNVNNAVTSNTANNTTYVNGKTESNLNVNNATTAGTANNSSYLGGVAAASYVQNTDSRTLSGNLTFSGTTSTFNSNIAVNGLITGNLTPTANVTYNLGSTTSRWKNVYATDISATSGTFSGNVNITGDLIVSGNVTTTNVSSVVVSDPLIYLAGNNYTSDLVDIGFAGNYNDGVNRHTGLFRDATDGIYKLFKGLTQELDGALTVNTADPTFAIATLNAYLSSGGLVSNGTNVTITANSTLAVGITANTLSLSTALPATSGGTGLNTFTSGDLLVANTGNTLSKLSVGTDGYVLQVSGSSVTWSTLDGGTF